MQSDGGPEGIEAVKKITVHQRRYRDQRNESTWTLGQMKGGKDDRRQEVCVADWAIHWAVRVPQATTEFGLK